MFKEFLTQPSQVTLSSRNTETLFISHQVMFDSVTPWTAVKQALLSFIIPLSLHKLIYTESVMQSKHLIVCHCFSSCLQSFTASEAFPVNWFSTSGSQNIGASASASVLAKNIQGWFPLGLTSLISLKSKGLSRVFCSTTSWKHQFFGTRPSLWSDSQSYTWLLGRPKLLL